MRKKKSVLLIYPDVFSHNPGSIRIKRFIRALCGSYRLVVLTKGRKLSIQKRPWGTLLVTPGGTGSKKINKASILSFSSIKSFFANKLLSPDAGIWWNYKVLKEESFKPYFLICDSLITSSPPHSVHLLGKSLADIYSLKWLMDMRDGWLDEPLKDSLFFLKSLEKKQEKSCLNSAQTILCNTDLWKKNLLNRYPFLHSKTEVLTNAVDSFLEKSCFETSKIILNDKKPYLLYAGSFRLSDKNRKASFLLEPLLKEMKGSLLKKVLLIGNFSKKDVAEIEYFQTLYRNEIELEIMNPIFRGQLAEYISKAAGLLLSSHSKSALPSKFFDYLASDSPLLCLGKEASSLALYSKNIERVFFLNLEQPSQLILREFLLSAECEQKSKRQLTPQYKEEYFSQKILGFL